MATLARAAATAVRQKAPTAAPPEDLRAVPLPHHNRLTLANGMEARPSASWQRDWLTVTALRVSNGSADAATWLYAISRQPFDESLDLP